MQLESLCKLLLIVFIWMIKSPSGHSFSSGSSRTLSWGNAVRYRNDSPHRGGISRRSGRRVVLIPRFRLLSVQLDISSPQHSGDGAIPVPVTLSNESLTTIPFEDQRILDEISKRERDIQVSYLRHLIVKLRHYRGFSIESGGLFAP
jgi:hypothetical protein